MLLLSRRNLALVASAVLVGSAVASAKTFRGTLTGTVTDPSGAVVPNATVQLLHASTNDTSTTKSNIAGYQLPVTASRHTYVAGDGSELHDTVAG